MAQVIIIGGHGKVALLLAPLLTERGDGVTSIIRNPDHAPAVEATGARAVVADVESLDAAAIAELLRGHDAVVWSAGAGGGNPARTRAVDRDAAIRTVDAAESAGVRRFVMVSYLGARTDHGVPADSTFFPYAEAKAAADEHLRASSLEWTIVAPGGLTLEEPSGRIDVVSAPPASGGTDTSRANVAHVVRAVLDAPATAGRMIEFHDGDTPIAEAIGAQR
ncbi:MAG TPA: SDR family oxidoreductase [Actinomycetaceae bacterium]|nr:SDR family oxidoreductase [Actinomycetaceae bacterium]